MMIGRVGGWMEWRGAVKGRAGDGDGDGDVDGDGDGDGEGEGEGRGGKGRGVVQPFHFRLQ